MSRSLPPFETTTGGGDDTVDAAHHSIRDRFKRSNLLLNAPAQNPNASVIRRPVRVVRSARAQVPRFVRMVLRNASVVHFVILIAVFLFLLAPLFLESSITSVFRGRGGERRWAAWRTLKLGTSLKFMPLWRFAKRTSLDQLREEVRVALRPPRIAVILGKMGKDPESLMLFTIMKNLQELGYIPTIFAVNDGEARSAWDQFAGRISILNSGSFSHIDWSIFEGIVADSLEVREIISSLMQVPFCSVPLIWIVQESTLANRLPFYEEMGWEHLVSYWRNAFKRADVIVFPDFSLPMLYSEFDTGNFFVIPGSPKDVWSAECFSSVNSKHQLRLQNGFKMDDMVIVVAGSSFFFNEMSWDYAVAMHDIGPVLSKYSRRKDAGGCFHFLFLYGNSTNDYDAELQEMTKHLRLDPGCVRRYGLDIDVNLVLLVADIVIYGSSQDEQGFPSLLTRAMSFGIPVMAPDFPVIKKYMVDGIHGIIFPKHNPDALMKGFTLLISNAKLSKYGRTLALSGQLMVKNIFASECISGFAKLLETVLNFPSEAVLPLPVSHLPKAAWYWDLFKEQPNRQSDGMLIRQRESPRMSQIVYALEEGLSNLTISKNLSLNENDNLMEDIPTKLDWNVLSDIEKSKDFEMREMEEIIERTENPFGSWDEIYQSARKAEKLKFEMNERDEGELERTGQPLCIYEIYKGMGTWPFLHHGSLYRGLSLSKRSRRLNSDDVDAVGRLPILNDVYYQDMLCEIGGMFSIANKIDNIHKRPWIGFQSWRAAGRKLSLSSEAERVLEETVQKDEGDVVYFWARLDRDAGFIGGGDVPTFWSLCDTLNSGQCRSAFEDAFRRMYGMPSSVHALPPMPLDGGHWSALHSWVMPTSSFLEFIMFSRMFVDSLDASLTNSSKTSACVLGSSEGEKRQCYCRVMEVVINVWGYHSGRKMVYLNPRSGVAEEQHPLEQRKGWMWAKWFDPRLLKHMDEDLAEGAEDGDYPEGREGWVWPRTGEVHWQGVYEWEREDRYRRKMDKKRKTKQKLYERMKHGYKQKAIGA